MQFVQEINLELRREYLLDVVRSKDGRLAECGARFARVELSAAKAAEIARVADLKSARDTASARVYRACPTVCTDSEVVWLDANLAPLSVRLHLVLHLDPAWPPATRLVSLVHVECRRSFFFWNMVGSERFRTVSVPIDTILDDLGGLPSSAHLVAPGVRCVLNQAELGL